MRGRITVAVLALAAFCASFGAPLQPLFAASMSCCPSGKAAACCKRHRGAGWVGTTSSCGATCACAFPSSGAPMAIAAAPVIGGPAVAAAAVAAPASADAPSFYQAFLFQRPPPARA